MLLASAPKSDCLLISLLVLYFLTLIIAITTDNVFVVSISQVKNNCSKLQRFFYFEQDIVIATQECCCNVSVYFHAEMQHP